MGVNARLYAIKRNDPSRKQTLVRHGRIEFNLNDWVREHLHDDEDGVLLLLGLDGMETYSIVQGEVKRIRGLT
jgi:hypothetical protein